jgi:hypothetical protein
VLLKEKKRRKKKKKQQELKVDKYGDIKNNTSSTS